jgi:hypothetical protein
MQTARTLALQGAEHVRRVDTGHHAVSVPSGAGRRSDRGSPSASPSHRGQSVCSNTNGHLALES